MSAERKREVDELFRATFGRLIHSMLAHGSSGAAVRAEDSSPERASPDIAEDPTRTLAAPAPTLGFHPGVILAERYRIVHLLGRGGMGEVYRADDLVLGQPVALKFLPVAATSGGSRLSRFRDEVRIARQISHPNVCRVYDIGEAEGLTFLSMEYVDGEDLASLLRRIGKLPQDKALEIARQLCAGLAAAHDKGVIHRDLKPANIMLDGSGNVRITDFGLAGVVQYIRDIRSGTPAYMSPEQVTGKGVTLRSDIYALGTVLHELLTGKRPPTPAGAELDPEIALVIQRCLEPDPQMRPASALQVSAALPGGNPLAAALARGETPAPEWVTHPRRNPRRLITAGAVMLALIAGWGLGTFAAAPGRRARPRAILQRLTWDGGLSERATLSNDGRLLAFASDRAGGTNLDIFVQQMGGGEPIRLTNSPADDTEPSFSPDGSLIAFRSERNGGGVYVIPSFGGQERLVAPRGNDPRFSPDGKWIAYWVGEAANTLPSARAYIIPAGGGPARQLQASFADARYPIWISDAGHILFQGVDTWQTDTDPHSDWWVAPLEGGKAVKTGAWDSLRGSGFPTIYPPGGWSRGRVVFSARDDAARFVLGIPVSTRTWQVQGPAEMLTFGTGIDGYPYPAPSGAIAFTSYQFEINIWSRTLDESGRVADKGARKLTAGAAYHTSASIDSAGARLAFLLGHAPSTNVWIRDLKTGRDAAVTVDAAEKCSAAISADGGRVAWSVCGPGPEPIYVAAISPDLSVPVSEKVCDDCGRVVDWSRAGDSILFVDHSHPVRAGILTLSSRSRVMISSARYNLDRPRFSPDGNWIALRAGQTGGDRAQILAVPLRHGQPAPEADWAPVTDGTFWDDNPVWTERGDALVFYSRRDGFGCFWRQAVSRTSKRAEGPPSEVLPFHGGRFSIRELTGNLPSLFLAKDQLVFNALERTGSTWVMKPAPGAGAGR
jgi:eukaryotic-like serine/threonine-protein kinase